MCFITIKLRRSYGVTAIALWPVVAKNCDAVTHNCDKKIVVTRSYDTKIVIMRKYVTVFRNSRFQPKCKSSATASYYFVSLPLVDEQSSIATTISLVLPYLLNIARHTHDTKSPLPIPFAKSSHILRFRKKFFAK